MLCIRRQSLFESEPLLLGCNTTGKRQFCIPSKVAGDLLKGQSEVEIIDSSIESHPPFSLAEVFYRHDSRQEGVAENRSPVTEPPQATEGPQVVHLRVVLLKHRQVRSRAPFLGSSVESVMVL